jgi:acylphosphatase
VKKNKWYKYTFTGFVQGVGFRSFCHYQANKFDISGSVKNLSNGKVEVIAGSSPFNLSLFLERIKFGPPGANVENITTEELGINSEEKGFKIL